MATAAEAPAQSTKPKANPKVELQQKVLHRYGWGNRFGQDEDGYWFVEIQIGMDTEPMRFVSGWRDESASAEDTVSAMMVEENAFNVQRRKTEDDARKKGITAASMKALSGLEDVIAEWEAKPRMELSQAFPDWIPIRDSADSRCWPSFWKHKPRAVGIDVEGNRSSPPVLVQIAVEEGGYTYCILETPQGGLSDDLRRLLADDSITKVFCDNYSHHDKTSLGIPVPKYHDWSVGTVVDLEDIAAKHLGPVSVARGLGRILSQVMPEINAVIEKPRKSKGTMKSRMHHIGRYTMIEQGKLPPLKGVRDLKRKEKHYAALDALATLRTYRRLIGENSLSDVVSTKRP